MLALISVVQSQARVVHVQVHVVARVSGQDGPGSGRSGGIDHIGRCVGPHHVGAAGSAHDAKDPGRGHHQRLAGRVQIGAVQRAAIRLQYRRADRHRGSIVREHGHRRHAGGVDFRIRYRDVGIAAECGDGAALSGEIAGIASIGARQQVDCRFGDLVAGVVDQYAVVAGSRVGDHHVLRGGAVIRARRNSVRCGLFVVNSVCRYVQRRVVGVIIAIHAEGVRATHRPGAKLPFGFLPPAASTGSAGSTGSALAAGRCSARSAAVGGSPHGARLR